MAVRLLFGFLSCLAFSAPALTPEKRRLVGSRPYLTVAGTLALRFQEAIPPPDLSVRPPAGAPPTPQFQSPQSIAPAPAAPGVKELAQDVIPPAPAPADLPPPVQPSGASPVPATEKLSAPSILPDDTKPKVHAEDFLPYFQFPGSHTNPNDVSVTPTPPAPGVQPPSSATYRQQ